MQRVRIAGLCLVVACASSAVAAASTPVRFREEPPEYGQCLPKPFHGVGNWRDAGCKVPKGPGLAEHKYEWYPGFGENGSHDPPRLITKRQFTSKIKTGTVAVLDVAHLETVTCTGETAKGEITGPKTVGGVDVAFTGCTEAAGNPCQGAGQPPETIVTTSLQGESGIIKEFPHEPVRNRVGLVLFFEGIEFECVGIPVAVRGSVIHAIAANAMGLRSTEQFTGEAGEQVPKSFAFIGRREQQPAFVAAVAPLAILETSIGGGPFRASSLSLTTIQKYAIKVEVSSIN